MAAKKDRDEYKLKLTGPGVTIDRPISDAIARRVTALVMGGGGNIEGADGEERNLNEAGSGSNVSLKAFMAGKRPSSDMERVTCLAYYLTNSRNTPIFKTRDLIDLNTEAAQPKMSNASATARNAVQNQYLSLAGGAKKQITARGEAVVEALPDREKVKETLEGHRVRRRRKSRKARKVR